MISPRPATEETTMKNPGKVVRRSFLLGVLGCGAVLLTARAAAVEAGSRATAAPDALVKIVTTEVLDAIETDPALRDGDFDKLQKLIDDKVAPYVDFERMTKLSVGPGWRSATPEQRQELMRQFRTYVVRTYSGALSRVTDHRVKMGPFHAEPGATDAYVRMAVVPSNGDPIELNFRLEKTGAGWKIYDATILGVSMVETFRNSFVAEVNQNGVAGLIKALSDRNKALAVGNRS
jgi:phospholipid transport system substrate-binding protein